MSDNKNDKVVTAAQYVDASKIPEHALVTVKFHGSASSALKKDIRKSCHVAHVVKIQNGQQECVAVAVEVNGKQNTVRVPTKENDLLMRELCDAFTCAVFGGSLPEGFQLTWYEEKTSCVVC